jgi:hypothetical protein
MAEPKTAEEAIAQARKERPEPTDHSQVVLGQIADALIGIRWALSSAKRSRKPATRAGDIPPKPVVGVENEEAAEEYRKNNPDADVEFVFTGVPRAEDSYVKRVSQTKLESPKPDDSKGE